jgi:hypothetical protein
MVVTLAESYQVLEAQLGREFQLTGHIAGVHVAPAVVVQVFARARHPILKAAALDFVALPVACGGTHVGTAAGELQRWALELNHRLIGSGNEV